MRADLNRAVCLLCPHSQSNQPGFKGGACACTIDKSRRDIVERAAAGDCEFFTEEGQQAARERALASPAPSSPARPCCGQIAAGIVGLAKVAAQAVGIPIDQAPRDAAAKRHVICIGCDRFKSGMCVECGCLVAAKVRIASEQCPLEPPKWERIVK